MGIRVEGFRVDKSVCCCGEGGEMSFVGLIVGIYFDIWGCFGDWGGCFVFEIFVGVLLCFDVEVRSVLWDFVFFDILCGEFICWGGGGFELLKKDGFWLLFC